MAGLNIKSLIKYIALVIVASIVILLWINKKNEKTIEAEELRVPVRVIHAAFGSLEKNIRLTGHIESENMVTVLPLVSGRIKTLAVDVGDTVCHGQIIAYIDPERFELQLRQAEAAYEAARSTYERTEELYRVKATTKQNYDQIKAQYTNYKNQYELAKLQCDYTEVKSPVDGVVLIKHTTEGALAAPQIPVMTIGDLGKLIVKAKVPEIYYTSFSRRSDIKARIYKPDAPEQKYPVMIQSVAPYVSPDTRKFEVVCRIKDEHSSLRPGMFVYTEFVMESSENIWYLPLEVLLADRYMWHADSTDHVHVLHVFENVFENNKYFAVPAEWKDYNFIIEGQHFLTENTRVKVLGNK